MCTHLLNKLSSQLDPQQLETFLTMAQSSLQSEFKVLIDLIESEQFCSAVKQAHHLKSTVCLIDCDSMMAKLEAIEMNESLLQQNHFKVELQQVYLVCSESIESSLKYYKQVATKTSASPKDHLSTQETV